MRGLLCEDQGPHRMSDAPFGESRQLESLVVLLLRYCCRHCFHRDRPMPSRVLKQLSFSQRNASCASSMEGDLMEGDIITGVQGLARVCDTTETSLSLSPCFGNGFCQKRAYENSGKVRQDLACFGIIYD